MGGTFSTNSTRIKSSEEKGVTVAEHRAYELTAYRERNVVLKQMWFESYERYIRSPLWQSIRERVLERDGRACRGCGRFARQAHHTSYAADVMSGDNIEPIQAICGKCHLGIEFTRKRTKKLSLSAANGKLERAKHKSAMKRAKWDGRHLALMAERRRLLKHPDRESVQSRLNEICAERKTIVAEYVRN